MEKYFNPFNTNVFAFGLTIIGAVAIKVAKTFRQQKSTPTKSQVFILSWEIQTAQNVILVVNVTNLKPKRFEVCYPNFFNAIKKQTKQKKKTRISSSLSNLRTKKTDLKYLKLFFFYS